MAMRADKETETKMPKPDLSIMNKQSQAGQTYDQDKRGNMWAVMRPAVNKKTDDALPAAIYIPAVIVFTFAAIVFFAQQTARMQASAVRLAMAACPTAIKRSHLRAVLPMSCSLVTEFVWQDDFRST